ncbi:MAG: potassium channel family protein [Desulfobacterales bacterium]|nr:potassium channel family protein [Desulfobacterales bacterium]
MAFSLMFFQLLFLGVYLMSPLLLLLGGIIIVLGQVVGRMEGWSWFDSLYWTFITALTVGYGDIRPMGRRARVLTVVLAWLGLILSGLFVAIAVETSSIALKQHMDPALVEEVRRAWDFGD